MKITNANSLRLTVTVCALSTLLLLFIENTVAQELRVVTKAQLNSNRGNRNSIPPQPRRLSASERKQHAQQVLDGRDEKVSSVDSPITLSIHNMYVAGQADLTVFRPLGVSDATGGGGIVTFAANPGASTAWDSSYLRVDMMSGPTVGKYLIDIAYQALSPPKFTLTSGADVLTATGSASSHKNHLLFVTDFKDAAKPWDRGFSLSGDSDWYFYSCEISLIK